VSRVGRPEIGNDPMGINKADVFVMLKPRHDWRPAVSKEDLLEELEHRLNERVPGLVFNFTQPMQMRLDELISGVRADLAVKVFGDDQRRNLEVAKAIGRVMTGVPGATQVRVEATEGQGYLNVRLDRGAMARFGIPVNEVQEALETAVGGRPVAQLLEGNYTIDVTVQYPPELRTSPEAIGAIAVPTPRGARIPLAQIADIRLEAGPVQVSRERTQRFVLVQANVTGRDLGGFVADVRRAVAARVALPSGVFLTYGGEFENQARAMARLRFVVARLHALAVRPVVMLTGDGAETAEMVGRRIGVDEVRARLLPEDKVHAVRALRELHGSVAMLGDGVNDAPALAEATVGLAMGAAGSPATIETADVALMADDLTKLPYAVRLARHARRTIRFNIGLALGLKLVLAVGAVLGVVSLAVAVLVGDMGGSLAVTVNALRIARTRE
jgi:soluble P-type ATPase